MNYSIIVDAGHGGEDPGAVSGNLQEKDFNLRAANYMYNRFRELGIPVATTRTTDTTLTRQQRLNTMNNTFGTSPNVIILSNHINSGGGEGAEVIYPLRSNDTLARSILESIGNAGQVTRKYYQRRLPEDPSKDYYYIMRETPNTTSLLIEYGFIDNPSDVTRLQNNLLDYVEAVVKAVANYIGVPYVSPEGITENTYVVQSGDSLYSIARRFNTTVDELKRLNNLTSNNLQIGQVLIVSDVTTETPPSIDTNNYTVQSGDSLYSIARRFNTTVSEIIELNNLSTTVLQVGQQLRIPTSNNIPPSINTNTYTVKSGDSLYSIANRFNTTVDELKRLNNLTSNNLQIGKQLIIPTSTTNPTPPSSNTIQYTVQSGDSLWKIANIYDTTVDEIRRINNLSSNILQIGQVLTIPTTSNNNYIEYIVKSGDSLWKIANTYNTTVNEIRQLNNLTSNTLQIGQVLRIPR